MKYLLTLLLFISLATAGQKTFYTAPTGNDNNTGSINAPFFSLKKAWSMVAAGDTIYMRGGLYEYSEMQYLQSRNGTAGNLIKLWAYRNEKPIISRSATYRVVNGVNQDLIYCEGNYLYWKNIEIAYFSQKPGETPYPAVRFGYTNGSIFENISYHDNMAGFSVRGNSSNNLFLNCDFYRNQDPLGSDGLGTDAYDGADGLQMNFVQGTNNVIRNCRAWWNADDGFDLWENSGLVTLEGNWAFLNGYKPGTLTTAGNGTGIKLGSTSTLTTSNLRVVKNCIAAQNRMYGICENAAQCRTTLTNNTVASTGAIGYWFGDWNGSIIVTASGNLSYSNPENRFNSASILTGNSWQTGTPVAADFLSTDINQLSAARKADGSLPDINYLRPVAGKWTGLGALASGQVVIIPPPPAPVKTVLVTIHVYSDKTVSTATRVNTSKTLVCDVRIYSDGSIEKVK